MAIAEGEARAELSALQPLIQEPEHWSKSVVNNKFRTWDAPFQPQMTSYLWGL